jgi:hypothetical protein
VFIAKNEGGIVSALAMTAGVGEAKFAVTVANTLVEDVVVAGRISWFVGVGLIS